MLWTAKHPKAGTSQRFHVPDDLPVTKGAAYAVEVLEDGARIVGVVTEVHMTASYWPEDGPNGGRLREVRRTVRLRFTGERLAAA